MEDAEGTAKLHIKHAPGDWSGELPAAHTASDCRVHVLELSIISSDTRGATQEGGEGSEVAPDPQGSDEDNGVPRVV